MANLGTVTRDGLIAGDYPLKTWAIEIKGPAEFKRGDVIGQTAENAYALADATATNGAQTVVGIICDDVTVAEDETATTAMYIKGEFSLRSTRFGGDGNAEPHLQRMAEIGLIVRNTKVEGGSYQW